MGALPEKDVHVNDVASNGTITSSAFMISDDVAVIFQYIGYSTINNIIDILGIVTNSINIICFLKLGFKDSVNVSLFGLAISDLASLVTLMWLNVLLTPAFQQKDLPFDQLDTQYLTASWPHVTFSKISSFITAFITLERCLCITMPLKVKLIFTTRRVSIIIASVFIILILIIAPVFSVNIYTPVFYSNRNKTIWGIFRTKDHKLVEQILFTVNVIIQFVSYIFVIVCSTVLVISLQRKTKWRQLASSGVSDNSSSRDHRVAKMILMISAVFIISFIPLCVLQAGMAIEKELAIEGKYKNAVVVMFGCGVVCESLNATVNVFIYYKMSTKFRITFRHLFRLEHNEKQDRAVNNISQRGKES